MKYFIYTLLGLAVVMTGFNISQINFNDLFSAENNAAFIALLAALCVIVLCAILIISKKIEKIHTKAQG